MANGTFVLGVAVAYALGTWAGRGRYEQIKEHATGVGKSPRVQRNVDTAKQTAKRGADSARQKVRERVPGRSSSNESEETASPTSAHQLGHTKRRPRPNPRRPSATRQLPSPAGDGVCCTDR
jgi:hypothetical protein